MATTPRVSIVIPLFDDEDYVAAALDSCLAQTITDIEIICVDDSSTDGTVGVVEDYQRRDSRIRLIRQPTNLSAFQARRAGIDAATAPYVLFLDGDDELVPRTAELALARADATGADVIGFGVEIIALNSGVPSRLLAALQPKHDELMSPDIVTQLFPVDEAPNGHLWRYLFATSLLRAAYDGIPEDLTFYRANDLPISFLALAHAEKYASTAQALYRYYFRRGTSGHVVADVDHFRFLLGGIDPIAAIAGSVRELASASSAGDAILESYKSARIQVIGNVLRYCVRDTSGELRAECLSLLEAKVGALDLVRAAIAACPEALPVLSVHTAEPGQPESVRSVLLTTRRLDRGGLQSVLYQQAAHLIEAGFRVTVAVMESAERQIELPSGVTLVELTDAGKLGRIDHWATVLREHAVDVVIDHYVVYNDQWLWRALAGLAVGVPTIGWIHTFALRPLFDQSERSSFLAAHLRILQTVVTLSPTDVAYWKLRGVRHVVYLPNPLSELASAGLAVGAARGLPEGRLELAWWGRLDRGTKQVDQLVEVAGQLRERGVDFRLTIIGPDSRGLSAKQVRQFAADRGVDDAIDLLGEQNTDELLSTLSEAHLLVSTSAIEGFQLTIIEAQALGIPVVMYDLPWLTTVRGNEGLVATPQGDPAALADAISAITQDRLLYSELSRSGRRFAADVAALDVNGLLLALLAGTLPALYSPEPTLDDARLLIEWLIRIGERNVRNGGPKADASTVRLRRQRDKAQAELRHVMDGPSFRLGRALTFLPRKARDLVRPARNKARSGLQNPMKASASSAPPPPLRRPGGEPHPALSPTPDVSFVIPVYNSGPWLDDCISSVLAQTGVDVEVICINDGSTDDSRAILQRFADADPRVTVIDQPNSGQSVGRNVGLDAAAGRYIIYLDSDDYWPYDLAQTLVSRADADDLDVLLFDCIAFRDGDVDEKTWKWYSTYYQRVRNYRGVENGRDLMVTMRRSRDYRPHVGLYMARTSYIRQSGVRFIPGIVHQDNPYTFRLMINASRAAYERVDAYARRIRPGSTITTLKAERSARGYFLSYVEMTRELEAHDLPADAATVVNEIVDSVYEGARKQFALISDRAAEEIGALDDGADAQAIVSALRDGANLKT